MADDIINYSQEEIIKFNRTLTNAIMKLSTVGLTERQALSQWEVCEEKIFDEEDERVSCICGHVLIKRAFRIKNKINHEELYPIGSTCADRVGIPLSTEFKESRKVFCACGSVLSNISTYQKHLNSYKHLKFLWPTCEECGNKTPPPDLYPYEDGKIICIICRNKQRRIANTLQSSASANRVSLAPIPQQSRPASEMIKCKTEKCNTFFKKQEPWRVYCKKCYSEFKKKKP